MTDRAFAVGRNGDVVELGSPEAQLRHMGISPEVSAAYDIMTDDGVPPEDAIKLALAAERKCRDSGGMTPEQFARHFVKLRKTMRAIRSG